MQDVPPGVELFSSHLNCRDISFFWATRGLCWSCYNDLVWFPTHLFQIYFSWRPRLYLPPFSFWTDYNNKILWKNSLATPPIGKIINNMITIIAIIIDIVIIRCSLFIRSRNLMEEDGGGQKLRVGENQSAGWGGGSGHIGGSGMEKNWCTDQWNKEFCYHLTWSYMETIQTNNLLHIFSWGCM